MLRGDGAFHSLVESEASVAGANPIFRGSYCLSAVGAYLLDGRLSFGQFPQAGSSARDCGKMPVNYVELSSIYRAREPDSPCHRCGVLIVLIARVDWLTKPYISIGFLYLFPIMLVAGFLPRWQIIEVALFCAVLQEVFSDLPSNDAITRLIMASAGFVGTGLFVSGIVRSRQMALEHIEEVETQNKLRHEAEEERRIVVESSPAAIVTIDASGADSAGQRGRPNSLGVWRTVHCGPIDRRIPAGTAKRCAHAAIDTVSARNFDVVADGKTEKRSWRQSGSPTTPQVPAPGWRPSSSIFLKTYVIARI